MQDRGRAWARPRVGAVKRWLHVFILLAATSLVYSNTLDNAYHLDSVYRV